MKNKKSTFGSILTSTLVAGAIASSGSATAAELISYDDLGSGAELRADLLDMTTTGFKSPEAKCGEGKCGEGKGKGEGEAKSESKAAEHKCGEGKCGAKEGEAKPSEGKVEMKSETKAEPVKGRSKNVGKSGEAKPSGSKSTNPN